MEESRVAGKRGGGAAGALTSGTKGGGAAARGKMSKGKRGPAGSADEALMSKMGETIQVSFSVSDLRFLFSGLRCLLRRCNAPDSVLSVYAACVQKPNCARTPTLCSLQHRMPVSRA